ncbi:putative vtc domain-containing protein [Golovinomyces cichoracearum]|uniref:Putative vtc domain-containing protein n=1 Tax=Golovinomyces cichoracearum TaxID=62708 RepID=A0A420IPD2_9PEZI|nr:putative vtc domain-containing protein [Golovinomyces cichoracearum]
MFVMKSKFCGLARSKSCSGYENLRSAERKDKKLDYARSKTHRNSDRKSRQEKYEESFSSCSTCSSLEKRSPIQTTNKRASQPPPESSPISRPLEKLPPAQIAHQRASEPPPEPPSLRRPLSSWPPTGFEISQDLSPEKANELIATGAPIFSGYRLPVTLAGKEYYHLFATCSGNDDPESDGKHDKVMESASMRLHGSSIPINPWETLEQPSMAYCYGSRAGTIRLNHWVNQSSRIDRKRRKFDMEARARDLSLSAIIERLKHFEDITLIEKFPHQNVSRITELIVHPKKATEFQIHDLITVLSRHSWIDFSEIDNQVVANYFANATYTDEGRHKLFFHQLLFALELELRIRNNSADSNAEVLKFLPEKIKWDIALAKIWRNCISIKSFSDVGKQDRINFQLLKKKEQLNKLQDFATTLKWPTLSSLIPIFSSSNFEIENYLSDTISYFTAVILPGPTLPFLLMNSLIDVDPSSSLNFSALKHDFPNTGFQYRSATFWTSKCIVGKVLAPTCKEIGGWIGPVRPVKGLERTQIARISQLKSKRRLQEEDVQSMNERSLPLGPVAAQYPIKDYVLIKPNTSQDNITDTIRIEELVLLPISSSSYDERIVPQTFDASIQFAVNGSSWPLMLKYDVSFISACSCKNGPHPVFYDYEHQILRIEEILVISNWAEQSGGSMNYKLRSSRGSILDRITSENTAHESTVLSSTSGISRNTGLYDEEVLVIESYGVVDNEVLARAWCSHWGLSALVADIRKTCMACAIREAYACCLNVLILIDSLVIGNEEVND